MMGIYDGICCTESQHYDMEILSSVISHGGKFPLPCLIVKPRGYTVSGRNLQKQRIEMFFVGRSKSLNLADLLVETFLQYVTTHSWMPQPCKPCSCQWQLEIFFRHWSKPSKYHIIYGMYWCTICFVEWTTGIRIHQGFEFFSPKTMCIMIMFILGWWYWWSSKQYVGSIWFYLYMRFNNIASRMIALWQYPRICWREYLQDPLPLWRKER